MRHLHLVAALLGLALTGPARAQATLVPVASQQLVNPFAVPAPVAPATAPAPAPKPAALPPPIQMPMAPSAATATASALPPGLRAILIRDSGQGLLGSDDANALSIAVTHGRPVRIAGQDYQAEVDAAAIRLYASPKGRLVWEGSLGSPAPISAPLDTSQLKFVPPLSAGVGPGLKAAGAKAGTAEPTAPRSPE